jgi:tRNA G18 (ribose-2'-O)-methylase SpoU
MMVLLDHIRSAYNVGSLFRTCDSAGVDKIVLTGWCAVPPNPKLQKTALGSLNHVEWEHHCDSLEAAKYYQSTGQKIICLETSPDAVSLFDFEFPENSCLVFGNEEAGVKPEILALADAVVKIPQYGVKESLNVASAAAVAIYEYRRQYPIKVI